MTRTQDLRQKLEARRTEAPQEVITEPYGPGIVGHYDEGENECYYECQACGTVHASLLAFRLDEGRGDYRCIRCPATPRAGITWEEENM